MEDDILLFGEKESYERITEHFGDPKAVAEDFISGLTAAEVSRFAFTRLRSLYLVLCILLLIFFGFVIPKAVAEVRETSSFLTAHFNEYIVINKPEATSYSQWEHTVYNGEDIYWAYYPEEKQWKQIPKPYEDADTKPAAFGAYIGNENGWIHWKYDAENNEWILVEEHIE